MPNFAPPTHTIGGAWTDFTAPNRVGAFPISNHKYQTYLMFTTPDLAASNRIPAIANESEQTGTRHQLDVASVVTNMAKNIIKLFPETSGILKMKTSLWNNGNNASAI